MTYNQMKNLKVKLPPYFVCFDGGSKHENKFSLSYHFTSDNDETINIWFDKDCDMWKGSGVSLGIYNHNIKDKSKRTKTLINKNVSVKELQEAIMNIRF